MQPVKDIAARLAQQKQIARVKAEQLAHHSVSQQRLLDKTEDLKLTQVVQTKILSDQLSGLLGAILEHLETKEPEVTKEELLTGIDQVVSQLRTLSEVMPKELQTLGDLLTQPQENYWTEERLVKVLKETQPQFPEIVIPEPAKEVAVTNMEPVVKLLEKIAKKPDFEKTEVTIPAMPAFPRTMTIDNLDEISQKLEALAAKEEKESKALGFTFEKDSEGNLISLTEIYENGTVKSTGWNLGRVKVEDDRER